MSLPQIPFHKEKPFFTQQTTSPMKAIQFTLLLISFWQPLLCYGQDKFTGKNTFAHYLSERKSYEYLVLDFEKEKVWHWSSENLDHQALEILSGSFQNESLLIKYENEAYQLAWTYPPEYLTLTATNKAPRKFVKKQVLPYHRRKYVTKNAQGDEAALYLDGSILIKKISYAPSPRAKRKEIKFNLEPPHLKHYLATFPKEKLKSRSILSLEGETIIREKPDGTTEIFKRSW